MHVGGINLATPFVAAPLAGVSSPPFRVMARRLGASLTYTEMVSAKGLTLGQPQTVRLARLDPEERPAGVQLFGADPHVMHDAAAVVVRLGADLIDINLGCPVRKVRRQGAGSALLDDPARAAAVVAAVKEAALSLPVTVKLRLGYDRDVLEGIVPGLVAAGAQVITLHARTAQQGYAGQADWEAIKRLKSWCPVPVIGNGDANTPERALAMLQETGCDAVMIGRGAMGNPWIFAQAADLWRGLPAREVTLSERRAALDDHVELAKAHGGEGHAVHFIRKYMMWYSRGLPGATAFRRQAGPMRDLESLMQLIDQYFARLSGAAA